MKKLFLTLGVFSLTLSANAATLKDVNFVLMGGYTSCGAEDPVPAHQAMYLPFQKTLSDLKKENPSIKFHYLISCLNNAPPPDGETPFITSEDPNTTFVGNGDEIVRRTREYLGVKDSATFVIGHSYGGWLAMYVGQSLKEVNKLSGLYTIDPIGIRCDALGFIFGGRL